MSTEPGDSAKPSPATRPILGVTGPDKGGWPAWLCTRLLIWYHGGQAVRITPQRPHSIDDLHGLVIGGGADIHPQRYNEQILSTIKSESRNVRFGRWLHFLESVALWLLRRIFSVPSTSRRQDILRDELEFGLLNDAVKRQMPLLGICRGGQLINVHFGGTLFQDISDFYVERPNLHTLRARKLVHVESGSTLYRLTSKNNLLVNSLHNQSVKTVGQGLRVTAREMNGVIQAVEHRDLPFVLGVQWHPEFLPLHPEQRRIFHFLVESARVFQLRHSGSLPLDQEIWNLARN